MTTPQTPYGQPQHTASQHTASQHTASQHTASPQRAYDQPGPGRPSHDRSPYPQPSYGRHGQAPQRSHDQQCRDQQAHGRPPRGQQSYGQQSYGPQSSGQPGFSQQPTGQAVGTQTYGPAGPQSYGPAGSQSPGHSGPHRVPGNTGPQQRIPGNTGSQQRIPGNTGPQQQVPGNAGPQAPVYARDAREIPAQPAPAQLPYPAGRAPKNGFGTTALVLGIIGALFAFIPVIGMIAWPLVILGLIFGILGIARAGSGTADNRGVAISGTVLSAIGLIICIVWASAFGAAVSSSTPAGTPGSAAPAASAGAGDSTAPAAFPGATSNDVTGKAGDTLTVGDMQIQATAMEPGDSVIGQTLCSTVTYTNTGSTTAFFNGGFDWKLQDPAGAAVMSTLLGADRLLSAGQLAPGGTTSGTVCFDRPSGASGQYVLLYDAMTFSSTRGAWLNKVG